MERKWKTWIGGLLCGFLGAVLFYVVLYYVQFGAFPMVGSSVATGRSAEKAEQIEDLIEEYYLDDIEQDKIAEGMYAGMLASLNDPYARYYSKEQYQGIKESSQGIYTGVGLVMSSDPETGDIYVVECYEEGPADKAGVQKNDLICKIDGKSTEGMTLQDISRTIRESEKKQVILTLQREGAAEEMDLVIPIETIDVPAVKTEMFENNMGYLQITEFTQAAVSQFEKAYQELCNAGMQGLIVDLRGNPGGLLDSVCDILSQILPKGMMVYTEDKQGKRMEHVCKGETPIQVPLVVLINEESASASEIFAGAVKDHGIGTLVGTTTFGKGIVQKTFPLADGSAVKITVSKYYTPNGKNIHGSGIKPDEEMENEEKSEIDLQLEKAKEILRTQVAEREK